MRAWTVTILVTCMTILNSSVWAASHGSCALTYTQQKRSRLTKADLQAIAYYTGGSGYEVYNTYLRTGEILSRGRYIEEAQVKSEIQDLITALKKIPNTQGTFRRFLVAGLERVSMPKRFPWRYGVIFDFESLDSFLEMYQKKNGIYVDPAFMSTTVNDVPSGMFEFPTLQLLIHGKTAKGVESMSQYDVEKEYLFLPGTKFKVVDIRGEFTEVYFKNQANAPEESQFIKFVRHYKNLFPKMTNDQIKAQMYNEQGTNIIRAPKIIVELEEI